MPFGHCQAEWEIFLRFSAEFAKNAVCPYREKDDRKSPMHVYAEELREFHSTSSIGFLLEILDSPAEASRAEDTEAQCAERKKIVRHDEVLQIQDARITAKRLEAFPNIEAKRAGKREYENHNRDHNRGKRAFHFQLIDAECDQAF